LENELSFFAVHKPGQARLSRMITLLSGLFLIAWGSRSLMRTLADPSVWAKGGLAWNQLESFGAALEKDAWSVDLVVVQEKFSPAFTIAAVVLILASLWWWRFINRERWAEVLIDMETELRKVSWPSVSDAWQSTLVVTGFTVTVVVTILVYDVIINGFIKLFVA
jgi:preprotein translocase SecE subunit